MKTKKLFFTLLALVILLSGISLVDAAGTWKNPTTTPPGNNTEAPVNVGTDAQDKAGVLRVTGFRSFFDAIFDTKVQIGTTASMPTSLKLLVDGKVGAEAYCDRQGNNCVTSSGIAVGGGSTSNVTGNLSAVLGSIDGSKQITQDNGRVSVDTGVSGTSFPNAMAVYKGMNLPGGGVGLNARVGQSKASNGNWQVDIYTGSGTGYYNAVVYYGLIYWK